MKLSGGMYRHTFLYSLVDIPYFYTYLLSMYLRSTKRKNKDGTVVEYYQLAHNERHPITKKTIAHIIHNFGRADEVDRNDLIRLCKSIARVCDLEIPDIVKSDIVKPGTVIPKKTGKLTPEKISAPNELDDFKHLENALKESENALAKAQEIAHLGNWVLDVTTDTFFWSEETYRIFGLEKGATPEEFWHTAHPEDKEMQKRVVEAAYFDHQPYNIDHRIIRPDGTERIVNEQAEIVCDDMGNLVRITGTVQDITERKKTEELLRRHRDHFEELVKERTRNLEEANTALRVLVKGRNEDKVDLEEKMLANVKNLVMPYIEKLKNCGLDDGQKSYLGVIESNLNDVISPFSDKLSNKYLNLTPMEIQVANLIKRNKTSKEIAALLNISISTIDFHRKNIRKKLGIKNLKANLRTQLLSVCD